MITIWVLGKDHMDNSYPILVENFDAYLVGAHVVSAKSLHSEVVDKSVLFQVLNI